jgi:predicted DNA-binding protein with PD1-like motif
MPDLVQLLAAFVAAGEPRWWVWVPSAGRPVNDAAGERWRPVMRTHEATIGSTIVVVFDHGDNFYTAVKQACADNGIRQGYIPMFIAGFADADLVGTCERLDDPDAPVWSKVHLTNIEALGGGTIAWDDVTDSIAPHIHVTVGLKQHSATAHTSHLLNATVQFLTEMIIVEVVDPPLHRQKNADLYDVPLLTFGPTLQAGQPDENVPLSPVHDLG